MNSAEMRKALQPVPEVYYPTPWRMAERNGNGQVVVVCAEGNYTCVAPTPEAAAIIVAAVNALAAR